MRESCYIGDDALITETAIARLTAMPIDWLGRLPPARYRLAKALKARAGVDGATWNEVGVLSPKKVLRAIG